MSRTSARSVLQVRGLYKHLNLFYYAALNRGRHLIVRRPAIYRVNTLSGWYGIRFRIGLLFGNMAEPTPDP